MATQNETVINPLLKAKLELVAHSTSSRANVLKPKIFLNLKSESLVMSASSQLIDKLDCLIGDIKDIIPTSKPTKPKPIHHSTVTTKNDLHKGLFEFISTPSEEGPAINQVLFETNGKSQLTWRYPERRSINRIAINPVPINRINQSAWPVTVQVELLFYDEILNVFVTLQTLTVSETEPVIVDFSTIENPAVSDKWQLRIPLYSCDIQPLSPFALAGCCRIDSTVCSKFVSSFAAQITIDHIIMKMDNDLECKLSGLSVSAESWSHLIKAQINSQIKLKIRDHKTLAFVPIMSKALLVAAVNIGKKTEFEVVLETCRLSIGQRIIHSLSQIISKQEKQSFYQIVNQTPYDFTINQPDIKKQQFIKQFESGGVYVITNPLTLTYNHGSISLIPGSTQIRSSDGITVECLGRYIYVYGSYRLKNMTPFNLAIYNEHVPMITLNHKEEKSLVKPIESLSIACTGFTRTRNIIIELKTHTALELECSNGTRINIGMSVIVNSKQQVLIIFSPLFIFRSYYPIPKPGFPLKKYRNY